MLHETGWYLKHRDGVEHGPFRLADLVAAAKASNIAHDTAVRHEMHTRSQWIFAPRIRHLAEVMTLATPTPSQSRRLAAPLPSPPRTAQTSATIAKQHPSRDEPTSSGESVSSGEPVLEATPNVRTLPEASITVPKTFVDAIVALFDFRFRRFVTPWIIKILWALCVTLIALSVLKLTYESLLQPMMSEPSNADPSNAGSGEGWVLEPLEGQSFLESRFLHYVVAVGIAGVTLLCVRVVLESAIVLFRVATDLGQMRLLMQQNREKTRPDS